MEKERMLKIMKRYLIPIIFIFIVILIVIGSLVKILNEEVTFWALGVNAFLLAGIHFRRVWKIEKTISKIPFYFGFLAAAVCLVSLLSSIFGIGVISSFIWLHFCLLTGLMFVIENIMDEREGRKPSHTWLTAISFVFVGLGAYFFLLSVIEGDDRLRQIFSIFTSCALIVFMFSALKDMIPKLLKSKDPSLKEEVK